MHDAGDGLSHPPFFTLWSLLIYPESRYTRKIQFKHLPKTEKIHTLEMLAENQILMLR